MADPQKALLALFEGLATGGVLTPMRSTVILEHITPHLSPKLAAQARLRLEQHLEAELGELEMLELRNALRGGLPGMPGSDSR